MKFLAKVDFCVKFYNMFFFFTLNALFIDAHSGKLITHTHLKILTRFDLYVFISSYFGAEIPMFFPVDSRVSEGADPLK